MYRTQEECLLDLEKNGQLVRIKEEVDPYLEMAAIHLKVHEAGGPALLFENIKGCNYRAVSNIFGTMERSRFIFRRSWNKAKRIIALRNQPLEALKKPWQHVGTGLAAIKALPKKTTFPKKQFEEIKIENLPLIHHWKMDGGAFVTLPQVYTENPEKRGIMNANLGMYRIQLNGNDYELNEEVGLHYQIHRGIGIHQTIANRLQQPLKVSCFVGGHPAHSLAAVMPLPEGMSEMTFAGMMADRRFRYSYEEGYCISNDADFIITGEVIDNATKPEGPFGDHLGYYSLTHPFPVMKIHKVYARKNAIWSFTVVGRPPQEDTSFGNLIHELTGSAIRQEIPGVKEVHAIDAAGVHPLLFAIGSERYTPYLNNRQPAEILTQANRILGTGQLSLAKYLFITAENEKELSTHRREEFLSYILERVDLRRDIHFQTNTTIDTLDYSGTGINTGSKVVFAAYGDKKRNLMTNLPTLWSDIPNVTKAKMIQAGILAIETKAFESYEETVLEMKEIENYLKSHIDSEAVQQIPLVILCDNSDFISYNTNNFLWQTFTRSNPSHDIYGIGSFTRFKHWGCIGSLIIDARKKPHHAPELKLDIETEQNIKRIFDQGGSLYRKI